MVEYPRRVTRPFAATEKVAMSPLRCLRRAVWFCTTLPMLAVANTDVPDVLLRLDCNVSSYCLPVKSDDTASYLSLTGGTGTLFLDWRPFGSAFFATAGTFTNQYQFGYDAGAAMVPASNISLSPLKPYIGTYLGVGWKGSSGKFMWMVDLGIVDQQPLNVVQNIQQSSGTHTDHVQTSMKWYASHKKRAGFSFRMKF
jgi:hypothetical protein